MKKTFKFILSTILSLFFCFSLTACNTTNGSILENLSPLKLTDQTYYQSTTINCSMTTYLITPAGFDFEELNKRGYKMRIDVSYDVNYTKNWDVIFDIGYLGAPKFEVIILNGGLTGQMHSDIKASSKVKSRTISYDTDVVNLIGSKVYLTFSSDNIQNKIHFQNIKVRYRCHL